MRHLAVTVAYPCDALAAMKLPGYPTTRQGWDMLVKRAGWPYREVRSKGRRGIRREYLPPPAVTDLIAARSGALPPVPSGTPARVFVAEAPAGVAYRATPGQAPALDIGLLAAVLKGLLEAAGPHADPARIATLAAEFYAKNRADTAAFSGSRASPGSGCSDGAPASSSD